MTNRPRGVLYIGVTATLPSRVDQHRSGKGSAFCKRYKLTRLVYAEQHRQHSGRDCSREGDEGVEACLEDRADRAGHPQWLDLWELMNA